MDTADRIARTLHFVAATYWTGALVFLALILTPMVSNLRPPRFQKQFARALWHSTHRSMWIALLVLIGSGGVMLSKAGMLSSLTSLSFYRAGYGRYLGAKLLLIVVMILITLSHDLLVGPGARTKDVDAAADRPRATFIILSWILAIGAVSIAVISHTMRFVAR